MVCGRAQRRIAVVKTPDQVLGVVDIATQTVGGPAQRHRAVGVRWPDTVTFDLAESRRHVIDLLGEGGHEHGRLRHIGIVDHGPIVAPQAAACRPPLPDVQLRASFASSRDERCSTNNGT